MDHRKPDSDPRPLVKALVVLVLVLGSAAKASAADPIQITVVFESATLPANAAALIQAAGGQVNAMIPEIGVMGVTGPTELLTVLNHDARIRAATPSLVAELPDVSVDADDAGLELADIDLPAAFLYDLYQWDIKQVTNDGASFHVWAGSHNTVVGIVDSGVNLNHPDLVDNLLGGRNFFPDGPGGTVDPADIDDRNGHGSHVAGNVAGNGWILGVGPKLGYRAYRVFGATGGAPWPIIIAGFVAAVDDGVDVVSLSLGGFVFIANGTWTAPDGTVHRFRENADFIAWNRAITYANVNKVVVVAAAGNDAINVGKPTEVTALLNADYGDQGFHFQGASRMGPTTFPNVVTVSATGPERQLSFYSNYGPNAINVSAPGGDSLSPLLPFPEGRNLSAFIAGGAVPPDRRIDEVPRHYAWLQGTSMAAPKVSATAALIIDQAKARGQWLTPGQVVTRLQQTAVDLGKRGHDAEHGHGGVNAFNALIGR